MIEGTFKVTTLGCKVNKAESIEIERQFYGIGVRRAVGDEVPEYWVINTCAVTATGMQKSRKIARKCSRTGANVIVTGCGVDFDRQAFECIKPKGLIANRGKENVVGEICGFDIEVDRNTSGFRLDACRVPVKIQDGCNHNCSYCVVPGLRNGPWNLPKESVIEKIKFYINKGAGEIILCGIDLGNYRDEATGEGLFELVKSVLDAFPGIWVRLSSIAPRDITGELAILLKEEKGLCRHVHIPLQSGDKNVLKVMNRGYDPDEYLEKIGLLKERIPGISITTDVMVGFPTEDEEALLNTIDIIRNAEFSKVHIFRYSPRPGTTAFDLGDPVSGFEKKRRSQLIAAESVKSAEVYHSRFVGRTLRVLVEEESPEKDGNLIGRTEWYSRVILEGLPGLVGKKVGVFINGIKGTALSGVVANT